MSYEVVARPLRVAVLTVSDTRTLETDKGGNKVQEFLEAANHIVADRKIVIDDCEAIINAMKNNNIFVITHPGDKGDIYIEEVAKVAKETNTKLEINSSHRFLNANQLRQIEHIGNTFIVGSDAHVPKNVGNFNLALNTIKEAKIDLSLIENIKF